MFTHTHSHSTKNVYVYIIGDGVGVPGAGDVVPPDPGVPLMFPAPPPPPPQAPPLQNVETFGSFLGEEIVANWRRSLERTILSQGSAPAGKVEGRSLPTPSPINATPPPTHNLDNPDDTGNPNSMDVCMLSLL